MSRNWFSIKTTEKYNKLKSAMKIYNYILYKPVIEERKSQVIPCKAMFHSPIFAQTKVSQEFLVVYECLRSVVLVFM